MDSFILKNEKIVEISSEQVLLGLLKTKIGIRSIRNYIFQGDYNEIKDNVENILDELPKLKGKAIVYIGDKKVELDGNSLEVENV